MRIIAVQLNLHQEQAELRDFEDALMRLEPIHQQKIRKFRRYEDRLRSLCGEMLLQLFFEQHWHLSQEDMLREVNSYGKPGLTKHPHYQYNVSHSGDWVAAAFDTLPVGIDVEKIDSIDLGIAERFFAPSEVDMLRTKKQPNEQMKLFYQLWTLKESYIKAMGKGLSIPLNSFAIDISNDKRIKLHHSDEIHTIWHFGQYNLHSDYPLAVCSQNPVLPEQIERLDWRTLLQCFNETHPK